MKVTVFLGCIDENALNYDSNANTDDGSCIAIVEGCTDGDVNTNGGVACNYDASANVDDDSCEYSTVQAVLSTRHVITMRQLQL